GHLIKDCPILAQSEVPNHSTKEHKPTPQKAFQPINKRSNNRMQRRRGGNATNSNYLDVLLEDVFDPCSAQVHSDADGEGKPSQVEEDGTHSPKSPQPSQVPLVSPKDNAR
ncbi:hypothetical protein GOP47_0031190, partial [Adiantum capillus-veneris]